jgi:hypothetical protein
MLGLQIVCALVTNELRGAIALRARAEGGTEAVITHAPHQTLSDNKDGPYYHLAT